MSCATARERAPELALGILSGAERSEVLLHLGGCSRCQAVVDEHTELADLLPHLAPEVEPPPGFERRVVGAMRHDRRRATRRLVAALVATAAAATITSVALIRVVDADRADERTASAPRLRTASMIGADGQPVGRVTVSRGTPAALAVSVDYAVPDGTYALRLHQEDGDEGDALGTITIAGGRGEWSGRAAIPSGGHATLALVTASGAAVCQAEIPV